MLLKSIARAFTIVLAGQLSCSFRFRSTVSTWSLQLITSQANYLEQVKSSVDWQDAVFIAQNTPTPDRFVACAAVACCGAAGEWQQALALCLSVPDADRPLLHATLAVLCKAQPLFSS